MLPAYKLRIPGNESTILNHNIPFNAFMHESCKITGRFILNPIGSQIDIPTHRTSLNMTVPNAESELGLFLIFFLAVGGRGREE